MLSLDKFASQLIECGLIPADDLAAIRQQHQPADAEGLARLLVKQKRLTAYQAQQAYAGKAKALVLGNYHILDKLGQGGMGMVLKARHRRMDRVVALKVLSPTVVKTPDLLSRFHREVKAAAKLQHPNIVMAFDADEANNTHFLVMEYVEGADLSALIKKSGPLPVDQAIHHITQAARGLEFAHKHGVIHRDIKPANLLLDAHGTVKILDMGLARIEGETGANAELTSTGAVMGTVDYMAPEQAMSTKTADARSDIYSLGITLWYLLTARPAYEGDSLMARLMAHANSAVPSLKAARPEVPDQLDAIYQKMVAKKPTDRFQTMTEVLAALEICRGSGAGDSRTVPGGSAGPSEDSRLSEMLALFGGGADPSAVTQTVTTSQKSTGKTRPTQGSEFEKTVTSAQPDAETDPTTLTSLRKTTGPQHKRRTAKPTWWQDKRIHIGSGVTAILLLVLGFVVTRGDPTTTPAAPGGANLASDVPGVPTSPKTETPPALNPTISPQPAPPTPPRLSLVYDGTILALVPSLDVDRTKPYTIEAWATPQADYPNGSGIVFLSPDCGLAIDDDRWVMRLETLGAAKAEKPLEKNRRVHVAGVRSENELILFVDGVVVARSRIEPKSLKDPPSFYIGTFRQYGYKGLIDEVRVSSGERYRKEFTPTDRFEADDQTIALYHFDEGQGSDIRDSSGNGHHGFVDNERFERVSNPAWVRLDASPAHQPRYPRVRSDLPDGFTPLFNGKDLTGWKGQVLDPKQRAAMSQADLGLAQVKADDLMRAHWSAKDGVLSFDGKGDNLCTARDYTDFELYLEWKIEAGGDTGVYLRGCPQIQIWDSASKPNADNMGSGGLYNNRKNPARPLLNADKPIGEWNAMLIRMVGDKVTVSLNGQLVVDNVVFENQVEPDKPMYPSGPIELQKFGSPLQFRNVLIRELKDGATVQPRTALQFDGKSSVETAGIPWGGLSEFTIEAWVRAENRVPDDGFLVDRFKSASLARYQGRWQLTVKYAGDAMPAYASEPVARPSGEWEHLAGVVKDGVAHLYVNGKHIRATPLTRPLDLGQGQKLSLGTKLKASIRGVRYSKTARYQNEFTPPEAFTNDAETLLLYNVEEGRGEVLNDSSGNNLHGRINGAKWVTAGTIGASPPSGNGWISVFDGETLNGWETVGEGGWSAADGVLKAAGKGKGWIGTSRTFKDYELELEYRIQAQGNGGIALRAWKEGGISAKPFFEVQIIDDKAANPNTDSTGSITGHVLRKPGLNAPLGEWNKVTVRLEGKHVVVTVNGTTTVDAELPIERVEGMIGLQVWDRPVEYRNIRVRELRTSSAGNPRATSLIIPAEALSFNGHRYMLVSSEGTWEQAKAKAEALGGHLVTINSKEERDWVAAELYIKRPNRSAAAWLGGIGASDTWRWVTDEPFDKSLWFGTPTEAKPGRSFLNWQRDDRWNHEWPHARVLYYLVEWDRQA